MAEKQRSGCEEAQTCHEELLLLVLADVLVCSWVDDVYADLSQVCRDCACVLSDQVVTECLPTHQAFCEQMVSDMYDPVCRGLSVWGHTSP